METTCLLRMNDVVMLISQLHTDFFSVSLQSLHSRIIKELIIIFLFQATEEEEEEAATVVDVEVMIAVDTVETMVDTMTVDTEEVEEEATEETVAEVDTIHTMIAAVDMVGMMVAGMEAAGDTMISKGATVVSLEGDKRVEQEH